MLLIEKEEKSTMFLSKILTHSCKIIQYILEETIFVVIVYKLLEQQTHWNVILMNGLKSMVNNRLRCQQRQTCYI